MKIMKPLIRESLFLLNIVGQDPTNRNVWSKVRFVVAVTLICAFDTELLLKTILDWNGLESIPTLAYFIAVYQVVFRAFALIVHGRRLASVLSMLENFWTPNQYINDGNDGREERDAQETYRIARKIMNFIFIIYTLAVIFFFGVFPIRRDVLIKLYHLTATTKSPDYELVSLMAFFATGFAVIVMAGFDFLYAGIIIHVVYELKIIKRKLRELPINTEVNGDDEGCLKQLALLIDHHNFVLRFIKKINKVYSNMLLNQFLSSIFSFATILIAITYSPVKLSVRQFFLYAVYSSAFTSQLYFFCLGGSFVTTECEGISDAAYECQWWSKTQPKLRNSIVLIIQRAQKLELLNAGGFIPVDLSSFTRVVNTAGSFFSVMVTTFKNRGQE